MTPARAQTIVGGMIDHITLKVHDIAASTEFYAKALAPLGYIVKAHYEPTLGFGVDDGTHHSDFYIAPAKRDDGPSPISHIAFAAATQQQVQQFYAAAIAAGGRDNGKPGPRNYHPGYYAAFVLDPDGNNIEAAINR